MIDVVPGFTRRLAGQGSKYVWCLGYIVLGRARRAERRVKPLLYTGDKDAEDMY